MAARAVEKLRDWFADQAVLKVTAIVGALVAAALAAIAAWYGDLATLHRGMLWGAAAAALVEAVALFIAWLWLYLPRRATATELEDLVQCVRSLVFVARTYLGPDSDSLYSGLTEPFDRNRRLLNEALVRSVRFKKRERLFAALKELESNFSYDGTWGGLKPHLDRLEAWADYVDRGFLLREPPNEDPLETPLRLQRRRLLADPEPSKPDSSDPPSSPESSE